MAEKYMIGSAIVFGFLLLGCSTAENPLEGKWQGTIQVSGKLSLDQLANLSREGNGEGTTPRTEVAVLTLEFLPSGKLKLMTEPMPSKSPFGPSEKTASYQVIENLPGQVRLELDLGNRTPILQLRYSDPVTMTVTEERGSPQLLPVVMTRLDAA